MKTLKKFFAVLFVLALMLTLCANAFAADSTYTVRIYAGNTDVGTVDGGSVITISNIPYGGTITLTSDRVKVTDDRYYPKGFRESGHDNNPVYTFGTNVTITRDMDFVVAYGMKSTAVQYTVSYLHVTTRINLLPVQIFYGNVGDKPVVAFQYVENYRPQALAITKTLTSDPTQNVFEFLYTPVNTGGGGAVVPPGGGGGGNANQNANQNAGQNAGGTEGTEGAPGTTTTPGTEGTPGTETTTPGGAAGGEGQVPENATPVEPVDILDLDVPQAEGPGGENTENQGALSGVPTWVIVSGAVILGGLVLVPIAYLIGSRSKKKKEETK